MQDSLISDKLIEKINANKQQYRRNVIKLEQNSLKNFWLKLGFSLLILLALAIIVRYLAKFN